ncbi:hypothetical protein CASFOL_005898 [Castilleja foliolosa]|uniref:Cytochrome P450 n=1 Tax=Castilleja foliolosa TaxID=1961234 RepID=A0ABD3E8R3_9LAMI
MSLKLGCITAVVMSTPETAKYVLAKNDLLFSSRKGPSVTQAFGHRELSMVWLPVGGQWRKLRKICKEQMFSAARLHASQGLRKEKLDKLRDDVVKFDIGDALLVGHGDGILKDTEYYFGKLIEVFDKIIDDKMKMKRGGDDLLEELINLNQRDELSRDEIKHLLMDLFTAGTDTTSGTVEWAMVELLRNPDKLSRLQKEIKDNIIKGVQESDIPRLPYLQAVVKETFRLHPTGPLLVPHKADADVEINGYTIPKDAQIIVNVWASGRDPSVWPDADMFVPERFLDRAIDLEDLSGLADGALATFVEDFGWQLGEGVKSEELDMNEKFGITQQKAIPLKAVRLCP